MIKFKKKKNPNVYIQQAVTDCHALRIGHGTSLFEHEKIQDPLLKERGEDYCHKLAQFLASQGVSLEVCLTSNSQTMPEYAE